MEQPQPREDVEEAEKAVMSSELNVIGALKGQLILGMLRGDTPPIILQSLFPIHVIWYLHIGIDVEKIDTYTTPIFLMCINTKEAMPWQWPDYSKTFVYFN